MLGGAKSQTQLQEEHAGELQRHRELWLLYAEKGFSGQFCRLGFLPLEEDAVHTPDAQLAQGGCDIQEDACDMQLQTAASPNGRAGAIPAIKTEQSYIFQYAPSSLPCQCNLTIPIHLIL